MPCSAPPLRACDHGGRRGEVHVRHPQRQDVGAELVPLVAVRVAPVDDAVESVPMAARLAAPCAAVKESCNIPAPGRALEQRRLAVGLPCLGTGFGCGDVGGLIVRARRPSASGPATGIEPGSTTSTPHRRTATACRAEPRRHAEGGGVRPYVGTKFRVEPAESNLARRHRAVARREPQAAGHGRRGSAPAPQPDLRKDGAPAPRRGLTARRVLDEVVPALEACGVRARSDSSASPRSATRPRAPGHRRRGARHGPVLSESLNPSAAVSFPPVFPPLTSAACRHARRQRGARSTFASRRRRAQRQTQRHAIAMPQVAPIASGADYLSRQRARSCPSSTRATPTT